MSDCVSIEVPEVLIKGEPLILSFTPEEWAVLQRERILGIKPVYAYVEPIDGGHVRIFVYCHNVKPATIFNQFVSHSGKLGEGGVITALREARNAINKALGIGHPTFI